MCERPGGGPCDQALTHLKRFVERRLSAVIAPFIENAFTTMVACIVLFDTRDGKRLTQET
jgi:hypothetical protein